MMSFTAFPLLLGSILRLTGPAAPPPDPAELRVTLTEWTIGLSDRRLPAGTVTIKVTNHGSIPHAFEVEGPGLERDTPVIQPGTTVSLTVVLQPGRYELYCPVGHDSHRKLGMEADLQIVASGAAGRSPGDRPMAEGAHPMNQGDSLNPADRSMRDPEGEREENGQVQATPAAAAGIKTIRVVGGGPVIQILPGSFPFADSAGPILQSFGEEHEALESQAQNGPYSNQVARIAGSFRFTAWDRGAVRDSVQGTALVTTRDGAHWKVVIDRVFTRDVPHHPKFGGVIMGLYYHGATGVHTPLVPTINSAVALWAVAHLYRNGTLVTDSAMVHVMLLSRTRRDGDFALACWDCSANKVEELQLQVTPWPGQPKFDAPGGFLFVNWEQSRYEGPRS